jgi:hypothetical protein
MLNCPKIKLKLKRQSHQKKKKNEKKNQIEYKTRKMGAVINKTLE